MTAQLRTVRLSCVMLVFAAAYAAAMWQPVRDVYSPMDKLAHTGVFFLVYLAIDWALLDWPDWKLVLLSAGLGGAVEIQQMFVPRFTASWRDWLADLVGIGAALAAQLIWRQFWGSVREKQLCCKDDGNPP